MTSRVLENLRTYRSALDATALDRPASPGRGPSATRADSARTSRAPDTSPAVPPRALPSAASFGGSGAISRPSALLRPVLGKPVNVSQLRQRVWIQLLELFQAFPKGCNDGALHDPGEDHQGRECGARAR